MDLVIMAGGMGSRFGGLKQIEPIDEYGNFIIDYSIFDAIRFGFDRVVFIIKKENFEVFKSTIGKRVQKRIKVEYVFQPQLDILPTRTKPWGTAHAILCCKDVVRDNFAVVNADDFYGKDAFKLASEYLKTLDKNSTKFALVGYKLKNTLSENGSAKRGICQVQSGFLTDIVECSVERREGKIWATPLSAGNSFVAQDNGLVSMNMFLFTPKIFEYLSSYMEKFLEENKADYEKCEFLLPEVVRELIHCNLASVKVLETSAVWQGVTYLNDKPKVVSSLKNLVLAGDYPQGLWN